MSNPNRDNRSLHIFLILGVIPVIWAALMVAPFISEGLLGIFNGFASGMNNPLSVRWCDDTPKTILIFLLIYGISIGIYFSTKHNYRKGEEHGSAKWGTPSALARKYADRNKAQNILLTKNTKIGLDGKKHRRNLNIMVVGGSGAGKTRFYAKPSAPVRAV